MDIFDDAALRRPVSFVLNLRRLPNELIHHVLDDLPLLKILQILAHKNQNLNDGVLTHQHWRRLFTTQSDIDHVTDTFILYIEVCRFTCSRFANAIHQFDVGCYTKNWGGFWKIDNVKEAILIAVQQMLPTNVKELALLKEHSTDVDLTDQVDLATRWERIKKAKRNLNLAKSRQFTLVADLLAKYPEMLMIKKCLDPEQGLPRKNLKHIENWYRMKARKILNNGRLKFGTSSRIICRPGTDNIEIVPYNRHLWFFLDILKKYPYEEDTENESILLEKLDKSVASLSISEEDSGVTKGLSKYPIEIRKKLNTIHAGLGYVYTGCPELIIERIKQVFSPIDLSSANRVVVGMMVPRTAAQAFTSEPTSIIQTCL